MSLDFSLIDEKGERVFHANITHNLGRMAQEAHIYKTLWRPEENGFIYGKDCVRSLSKGLIELTIKKKKYSQFNSPNGWGMYEHFVPFVHRCLSACAEFPDAKVYADR